MERQMFSSIAGESGPKIGGKKRYLVPVSAIIHAVIIVALIATPLVVMSTDKLPSVIVSTKFLLAPILPTPVIPSEPAKKPVQPAAKDQLPSKNPPTQSDEEKAPIVAPDIIVISSDGPKIPGPKGLPPGPGDEIPGPGGNGPPVVAAPLPLVAQKPFRVGGKIKEPVRTKNVLPVYPLLAQSTKVEGIVIVEITISEEGKVLNPRILRSIALLDEAALNAVRQWEFRPTTLNGVPIEITMTVTVNFSIR